MSPHDQSLHRFPTVHHSWGTSLGIPLASGTASDTAGNLALSAGPSTTFIVNNVAVLAVGGSDGSVRILNATTHSVLSTFRPLDDDGTPYTGLVEVALGDLNGDGVADVFVASANPSGVQGLAANKAGKVFVYDGASLAKAIVPAAFRTFTPFATTSGPAGNTGAYINGLNIAAGDINGDGKVDLVAGTRGGSATVGRAEYGRLIVIDGSNDAVIGSILTPFGAAYQKGIIVAAGNLDGIGGEEIAVTRGGPVAPTNLNRSDKLKAFKFTGSGLTELDLNGATAGAFAPFPTIERDARVTFVDPDGDGKESLVFSARDYSTPGNSQVRVAVFDVDMTTGLATAVSTGTGPSKSYLVGTNVKDHAIASVDVAGNGIRDLLLLTENGASSVLSGIIYLAPTSGLIMPGGLIMSITTGGVSIDGI